MRCMGLLVLVAVPLLMGQTCGITGQIEDDGGDTRGPVEQEQENPPVILAKTVTGPGFSLQLPAGFTLQAGGTKSSQEVFRETYGNGQRLVVISTETLPEGELSYFDASAIRIQGTTQSNAGDLILLANTCDQATPAERLTAYGLLASGNLLRVEVCSGAAPSEDDRCCFGSVCVSIDLLGTSGHILGQRLQADSPKLMGVTSNGLIVLDDLTAWILADDVTNADLQELRSWAVGSAIHAQAAAEGHELLQVGRWVPVPVRSLGTAMKTSVSDYDAVTDTVLFQNGHSEPLPYSGPDWNWKMGEDVLIVNDASRRWIIRVNTFIAILL